MDKLIPLFIFCCFLSGNERNITYRAASNDMAEAVLYLYENQEFRLVFKPLEEQLQYNFKGDWQLREGFYELTFRKEKSPLPDLHTLFEDSRERVIVVSLHQVRFRETESRIKIWGIICVRERDS